MDERRYRITLSYSVILLFSILILGQPAWSGSPDSLNHWPHNLKLEIQSVQVDLEKNLILIKGHDFNIGHSPIVTLGGIRLKVASWSRNQILAYFPAGIPNPI